MGAEMSLYKLWYDDANLDMDVGRTTAKSLGLSPDQRRLLALLHELSHATAKYLEKKQDWKVNQLYFDEVVDQSELNLRIYDACFPASASAGAAAKAN